MAIVRVIQTDGDPGELEARYRRVQDRLRSDGGGFPAAGLKVHTAMRTPNGLRIANVWESEEHAEAFRPRVEQILREEGGDPEAMRMEQYEVINFLVA